jgi:hypothetical protein
MMVKRDEVVKLERRCGLGDLNGVDGLCSGCGESTVRLLKRCGGGELQRSRAWALCFTVASVQRRERGRG